MFFWGALDGIHRKETAAIRVALLKMVYSTPKHVGGMW